ncbi:class D sortase [Fictibacillus nanhaiensis]|uniref:Class D sortase n=1 Tax=Fictibacillus nanhaiensis TaxID=742169 RepID=A0ABS2ZRP0_9BACL|nr:class D sortase [Fictibacillus nanhaiensis]
MKWLAYILIVAGISIMFYPKAHSMFYSYQEKQLLDDWSASTSIPKDQIQQSYQQLNDVFSRERKSIENKDAKTSQTSMIGKLTINKINLTIPIMEGASQQNLKIAAGHLKGTSAIGEAGNAAIAAHRSYTYGKQFNRLPEVEPGDLIQIETTKKILTYQVTKKLLVEPSDLSVLRNNMNESNVTLITCHPMKNPTHRYIVKAALYKEEVL